MNFKSISVQDLAEKLARKEKFRLIDVREPLEFEIARIEGAELMPMSRFGLFADSLNVEDELVIMCHHGIRSANVCAFLAKNGFTNVANLTGGIDAWSAEIDENVRRY